MCPVPSPKSQHIYTLARPTVVHQLLHTSSIQNPLLLPSVLQVYPSSFISYPTSLYTTRTANPFYHFTVNVTVTSTSMNMPSSVEYLTSPHGDERLNYDADPMEAMTSYARMMHYHTQQQMDAATRSARRRSPPSSADAAHQGGLSKQNTHSSSSSRSSF